MLANRSLAAPSAVSNDCSVPATDAGSDKTATLASLEHKLVKYFFKESKDDSCRKQFGLEQPMWVWTHHGGNASNCFDTEVQKLANLLHWLVVNCRVAPVDITIVAPSDLFKKVKEAFLWKVSTNGKHHHEASATVSPTNASSPGFPTQNNAESEGGGAAATTSRATSALEFVGFVPLDRLGLEGCSRPPIPSTRIGIVCFGCMPPKGTAPPAQPIVAGMRYVAEGATDAMIAICDVRWIYSPDANTATNPHLGDTWVPIAEFLRRELGTGRAVRLSKETTVPRGAPSVKVISLIGGKVPLCCPRHSYERALRSGKSVMDGFCRQTCLFPYACGQPGHVCVDPCHDLNEHRCPYPCTRPLRCGHVCQMTCSEPCDCLHEIVKPLPCSHTVPVGFDATTEQTVYRTITHFFKGTCVAEHLPCRVDVPVVCAHCFGDFTAHCAHVRAQGHTNELPTLVCEGCIRRERDIRLEVRHELVEELAMNKKELRRAMKKELSRYQSMVDGGFFQIGQRVYLNNVDALFEPFEPDFDESVKFEDFHAPDFRKRMDGIHGIVKASMTDAMVDVDDIQCLVEIPNGLHILASATGLQSVRALCSSAATSGATLMLTGPSNGNTPAGSAEGRSPFWGRIQPLVGSVVHVLHPVDYTPTDDTAADQLNPSCDPIKLVDVVGRILDEDTQLCNTMGEPHVKLEIILPFGNSFVTQSYAEAELSKKRPREGPEEEVDPTMQNEVVLVVSAPMSSVDVVNLFKRDILISDRTKQLLEPEELLDFYDICENAVKRKVPADIRKKLRSVGIRDYPCSEGEVFEMLEVVNYPFDVRPQLVAESGDGACGSRHGQHVDERGFLMTKQPHAILVMRTFFDHMRLGIPKKARSRAHGGNAPSSSFSTAREFPTRCEVAVVPLLFAGVDEEAEAERKLEAETFKKLQEISSGRYQALCEKLAFENEDARFQKEMKLPHRTQSQVDSQTAEARAQTVAVAEEEEDGEGQPSAQSLTNQHTKKAPRKYPCVVAYSMPQCPRSKHAISALESRYARLPQPPPVLKVTIQKKKAVLLAKQAVTIEGATGWWNTANAELAAALNLDKLYAEAS